MPTVLLPDQLFAGVKGPIILFMHPFFFKDACHNRVVYLLTAAKSYCERASARMVWDKTKLPKRFHSFTNANKQMQRFLRKHSNPAPTPYFLFEENSTGEFGPHVSMMTIYKTLRRKYLPRLQDSAGNPRPYRGKVAWSHDDANRAGGRALASDMQAQREISRAMRFDAVLRNRLLASPTRHWAERETRLRFPGLLGGNEGAYPHDRRTALACLRDFVRRRLRFFGYQDAIQRQFNGTQAMDEVLHSRLSMALNIGLLVPADYVAATRDLPMSAALEGFVRQVLGWREYANHCYHTLPMPIRSNHMGNHVKLPKSWYGPKTNTGIMLVDASLTAVWRTGYAHHIIRLMVLGNFALLSQYDPESVRRWFLTMFVDAHEWVMAMNVLCMSQYAVKGATKRPYFSSSRYLRRMSDAKDPEGFATWDHLYRLFLRQKRQKLKHEYLVSSLR